jgi:hypothetical protein
MRVFSPAKTLTDIFVTPLYSPTQTLRYSDPMGVDITVKKLK